MSEHPQTTVTLSDSTESGTGPDGVDAVPESAAARWLREREEATASRGWRAVLARVPWGRFRARWLVLAEVLVASMRRSKRRWAVGASVPGVLLASWMMFGTGTEEPDIEPVEPTTTFKGLDTLEIAPGGDPFLVGVPSDPAPMPTSAPAPETVAAASPFYGPDDVRAANEVRQAGFDTAESTGGPLLLPTADEVDGPAVTLSPSVSAASPVWLTGGIEDVDEQPVSPARFDHRGPKPRPRASVPADFDRLAPPATTNPEPWGHRAAPVERTAPANDGGPVIRPGEPGSSLVIRPR